MITTLKRKGITRILVVVGSATLVSAIIGSYAGAGLGSILSPSSSRHESITLVGKAATLARFSKASSFGAWVQRDADGNVCLFDGPLGGAPRSGGCNPASNPLGGQRMLALYTFDGGPEIQTVTNARLAGVVTPDVADVRITLTNGVSHSLALTTSPAASVLGANDRAFAYVISNNQFAAGIGPATVIAYDASGHVLETNRLDNILPPQ